MGEPVDAAKAEPRDEDQEEPEGDADVNEGDARARDEHFGMVERCEFVDFAGFHGWIQRHVDHVSQRPVAHDSNTIHVISVLTKHEANALRHKNRMAAALE